MGQKEHFCFYISGKILEMCLSGIPRGDMPAPAPGTIAWGLKDADRLQPLRAYSCFGAWSQFPLKHIDAAKEGEEAQMPSRQPMHFYSRLTLQLEKWALSDLLKGIWLLGGGAESGTQTHIFVLRALSKHQILPAPSQC